MDTQDLLKRLADDKIEYLWVAYHDYNGRACAKTIPKREFASVVEGGVVFARANLGFGRRRPDGGRWHLASGNRRLHGRSRSQCLLEAALSRKYRHRLLQYDDRGLSALRWLPAANAGEGAGPSTPSATSVSPPPWKPSSASIPKPPTATISPATPVACSQLPA